MGSCGSCRCKELRKNEQKICSAIRCPTWSPWEVIREYDTLAEAESDYDALPIKAGHRIAEAYTVVRYKAVKV